MESTSLGLKKTLSRGILTLVIISIPAATLALTPQEVPNQDQSNGTSLLIATGEQPVEYQANNETELEPWYAQISQYGWLPGVVGVGGLAFLLCAAVSRRKRSHPTSSSPRGSSKAKHSTNLGLSSSSKLKHSTNLSLSSNSKPKRPANSELMAVASDSTSSTWSSDMSSYDSGSSWSSDSSSSSTCESSSSSQDSSSSWSSDSSSSTSSYDSGSSWSSDSSSSSSDFGGGSSYSDGAGSSW